MGNPKLFKRILAGLLAAMIGLSALGGIIMAFAEDKEPDISLPDTLTEGEVNVGADEDWELLMLENDVDVTVLMDDTATITLTPDSADSLWMGWSSLYNSTIEKLADKHYVTFDVVDFVFSNQLNHPVKMTFTTKKAHLYRLDRGVLTPVTSEYKDGVHTFSTDLLTCFLASDDELTL